MPTNDERRRVAAALRGYARRYKVPTWKALCNIVLGREEGTSGLRKVHLLDRLADLIEPSLQCPYYSSNQHYCSIHDVPAMDRDALLALAEELDGLGLSGFSSGWSSGAVNVGSFARRIRKALGEE